MRVNPGAALRPAMPPRGPSEERLTAGRARGNSTRAPAVPAEAGKPAVEPGTPYQGKVKKRPAEIICGAAN